MLSEPGSSNFTVIVGIGALSTGTLTAGSSFDATGRSTTAKRLPTAMAWRSAG